ncbi:MAG: hypothetical protein K9I71_04425 [Ignavibacteriales bacterium]|nr:hypothetical protein [Ignavibacteriales bacterium]MCF8315343.1 hypothetical protein [Ignavibacteriales bacterium]MCF8436765.1 hypothetical protein [Ignavibacteriales bacterium]
MDQDLEEYLRETEELILSFDDEECPKCGTNPSYSIVFDSSTTIYIKREKLNSLLDELYRKGIPIKLQEAHDSKPGYSLLIVDFREGDKVKFLTTAGRYQEK